jgi:RNA binding exosome subunit
MSDKYPSLSPYTYCADNPVKLVDPNGEAWETEADEKMAKRMTDHANSRIAEYKNLSSNATNDEMKGYYDKCIGILQSQVKRIEAMGTDQDNTFHFKKIKSTEKGYVCARNNSFNSFDIGYTDDAMAFHEIAHYNSFVEGGNPYLEFSKKDGFLGINGDHEDFINNVYLFNKYKNREELKAYKAQFLYDPKTLPFRDDGTSCVKDLNNVIDWMKVKKLWLPIRPE